MGGDQEAGGLPLTRLMPASPITTGGWIGVSCWAAASRKATRIVIGKVETRRSGSRGPWAEAGWIYHPEPGHQGQLGTQGTQVAIEKEQTALLSVPGAQPTSPGLANRCRR